VTGRTDRDLLLGALRDPLCLGRLEIHAWSELLPAARRAGVLARLAHLTQQRGVDDALPPRARQQLAAARPLAEQHARILRWEVSRIRDALSALDVRLVLLKGAAYVLAGLPAGRGRLASDVDVLVPRGRIAEVERALLARGFRSMKLHPYDQRYYRTWSHELPPLRHERRRSVVDVHHTILPLTGRVHPDPEKLLAAA